ncbi:hypothetical protein F2Q69_00037672 [Brassica cretica]|uniref:Uncharacterized protein n=1 Tax=Brassica cretica TaxID=69181 RepID=A0A8S9SQE7_BRACR|nr:hypothetical protein F2Q69_00037672 [Brassica cretica]
MGDINANDVPNQADINAQLLAGEAQLTATMNAVTEQLARLEQGNCPTGPRPRRRNHPYLEDPRLHSDEDSSDSEPPDREEPRPVQAEREGRREHRIQGDGTKAIRLGFSKAVQQILDQDVQTDQDQLLIEEMIQLKIQDPAGSIEVQDQAGPIQFRSLAQNRTGLIISTCDLGSDSVPIQSRSERNMGDINANDVPNQADINAQLLAGQAQLTATMTAVTEQLARMEQGNRPNGPRPRRRNHPYLEDPMLHSDEDSSDSEPPDREEPRPEELLIEEMIQLKIQDQAGSIEVQDQAVPIQFRSLAHNRTGLTISTCDLG